MIRLILFAVVGLLAGLGGGSGFAILKAKKAHAVYVAELAKVVADSIAERGEGKAPVTRRTAEPIVPDKVEEHAPEAGEIPAAAATHAAPVDSAATPAAAAPAKPSGVPTRPATAPARATVVPVKPSADHAAEPRSQDAPSTPVTKASVAALPSAPLIQAVGAPPTRLAKIFAAMSPKDAGKVLVQLDDSDVRLIMGALSEKQAAAILATFPAERAAALSKAVMRGGSEP